MSKEERELIREKREAAERAKVVDDLCYDVNQAMQAALKANPITLESQREAMRLSRHPYLVKDSNSESLRRVISKIIREELKTIINQGSD